MTSSATLAPDELANMFVTAALHEEEYLIAEMYNELESDEQTWLTVGLVNIARAMVVALAGQTGTCPISLWQGILLSDRLKDGQ